MNSVTAVIPVRGGSQRLKNKNLCLIGDESLLARKIRQLKECKNINRIIVNSDSDEMLKVAEDLGVKTVKRDEMYASSNVLMNDAIHNVLSNTPGEHILWAQVTSPLISSQRIDDIISIYFEKLKDGYDSITTFKYLKEYLWDEKGPVNYEKGVHVRSQELKSFKALTFTIMIINRKLGIEKKYYIGENPFFVEMTPIEAVDIDDGMDLYIADCLLKRQSQTDNMGR